MRLTWSTSDPAGLRGWLGQAGLPAHGPDPVELGGTVLVIAAVDAGTPEHLEVAAGAGQGGEASHSLTLRGLGWATVDAARMGGLSLDALPDEAALGARAWLAPPPVPGRDEPGPWIPREPATIYLEPATEGLLAAALARHGEGPVCLWLRGAQPATAADLQPATDGPLGRERLVAPRSRFGPFVLLLDE